MFTGLGRAFLWSCPWPLRAAKACGAVRWSRRQSRCARPQRSPNQASLAAALLLGWCVSSGLSAAVCACVFLCGDTRGPRRASGMVRGVLVAPLTCSFSRCSMTEGRVCLRGAHCTLVSRRGPVLWGTHPLCRLHPLLGPWLRRPWQITDHHLKVKDFI